MATITKYQLPEPVVIDTHLPTNHKTRGYTAEQMHQAFAAGAASMHRASPCANQCEAQAFKIEIRQLTAQIAEERERLAYVKGGWARTLDVAEAWRDEVAALRAQEQYMTQPTMSKHTPGPWKAVYIGCGDWDLQGPITQEDWTIAAAAPLLLDALKKLACLGNGDKYGNSIGNQIAIEAIAAAEGAQHD